MNRGLRPAAGLLVCLVGCGGGAVSDTDAEPGAGDGAAGEGIAGEYPGDVGIGADPRVLFADDFESYADATGLEANWDAVYHEVRIATESDNVYAGSQSVELTAPQQAERGSNPTGETRKWYDNVVAATAYIGPLLPP